MAPIENDSETYPVAGNGSVDVGNMLLREYIEEHRTAHINSVVDQGERNIKLFREQAAHVEARTCKDYDAMLQSLRENIEHISNVINASKPPQNQETIPNERPPQRPRRQQVKRHATINVDSPPRPRRTRRKR